MSTFLAVDPGETTGFALFENEQPTRMGQATRSAFAVLLNELEVDFYVVEDFLLFPGKARVMMLNKMVTARVIGQVEQVAAIHNRPVHFQKSEILRMAYLRFGYTEQKKGKQMHQIDALMHGMWFLHKDDPPDLTQVPKKPAVTQRAPAKVVQLDSYEGLAKTWRKSGAKMKKRGL